MGTFNISQILTGNPYKDTLILSLSNNEEELGFIGDKIAPLVPVDVKKGTFPIIGYADKIKNTAPRLDDEVAKQTLKIGVTEIASECISLDERTSLSNTELNGDVVKGNNLKMAADMALNNLMRLKREKLLATKATTLANYGASFYTTLSGSGQFNHADATPIKTICDYANTARLATGFWMDSIMFTFNSYNAFINNSTVADKLATNRFQTVTEADVIGLLKQGPLKFLKNVYIAGSVYDSAPKATTRTGADVWGDDFCILFKQAVNMNGVVQPGAFVGAYSTNSEDFGGMEYPDPEKRKVIWLEKRFSYDPVMIKNGSTPYAYLLNDTNA